MWAALALLPPVLAACGGTGEAQGTMDGRDGANATVPAVEALQAREGALPLRARLTGTVQAGGQVAIFPQTSGPIVEVLAQNGEYVEAGDPLVRIRAQMSQSQLMQARASLRAAEAESRQAQANLTELEGRFERTQLLAEDSLVAVEQVETQRAQVEAARAAYVQAQAQAEMARAALAESQESFGQTVVRAPISGRVGRRNAEVGMLADGQTPLFTIGQLDSMRVEVPVAQEMLGLLEPGQRVELMAESLGDTVIPAEISRISPFLAPGSFSGEVEIDVANPAGTLIPGMFVTVDVFYGETDTTTLVPQSALYDHPESGQQGVYVAGSLGLEIDPPLPAGEDEVAPLTPPTLAEFQPIEVVAQDGLVAGVRGIEPGAWVVVVGQHLLSGQSRDGAPQARVRPVSWERILGLQRLQRQDLLREFMARQQRLGREGGDTTATGRDGADTTGASRSRPGS